MARWAFPLTPDANMLPGSSYRQKPVARTPLLFPRGFGKTHEIGESGTQAIWRIALLYAWFWP
eukprot:4550256-Pleurochrysis_carterae.AAC.1